MSYADTDSTYYADTHTHKAEEGPRYPLPTHRKQNHHKLQRRYTTELNALDLHVARSVEMVYTTVSIHKRATSFQCASQRTKPLESMSQ